MAGLWSCFFVVVAFLSCFGKKTSIKLWFYIVLRVLFNLLSAYSIVNGVLYLFFFY